MIDGRNRPKKHLQVGVIDNLNARICWICLSLNCMRMYSTDIYDRKVR